MRWLGGEPHDLRRPVQRHRNQYGAGDGSTTFNLPNAKGRVFVGRDAAQVEFDVLAETGGAKTHTLATSEIPAHNHGFPSSGNVPTGDSAFQADLVDKTLVRLAGFIEQGSCGALEEVQGLLDGAPAPAPNDAPLPELIPVLEAALDAHEAALLLSRSGWTNWRRDDQHRLVVAAPHRCP